MESAGLNFGPRRSFIMELQRGRLERYGVLLPETLMAKVDAIRRTRNMAAHGHAEPTRDDVIETIKVIESVEKHLQNLDIQKIIDLAKDDKALYEIQREAFTKERAQVLERDRSQQSLALGT
jgi:hypothetical protein